MNALPSNVFMPLNNLLDFTDGGGVEILFEMTDSLNLVYQDHYSSISLSNQEYQISFGIKLDSSPLLSGFDLAGIINGK